MNLPLAEVQYYLSLLERQVELSKEDPEEAHENADDLLCEILNKLGYNTIVDVYERVYKWYC